MWIWKLTLRLATVHPVEVHKQSHQASRRWNTVHAVGAQHVSNFARMTCNSREIRAKI